MEVFDAWEAGELIGEDSSEPGLVPRLPRTHITKTDLVPTLGVRDCDLVELAKDILARRVCIKANSKTQSRLTLPDWCRDKKIDRIIMNELMSKFKKHPVPCKDAGWVPYTDEAWDELCAEKNFSPAIVRNIWVEMKKYTDGDKWLNGRANPMNPSTDKSVGGLAPKVFFDALEKFTKVVVAGARPGGANAVYDCKHADSVVDVISSLQSYADTPVPVADYPKTFVLFAYSTSGDPVPVSRSDVFAIARAAKHVAECEEDEDEFINDEDEEAQKPPEIPVPMLFIGSTKLHDVVSAASNLKDTTWSVHTVHYTPSIRAGFKKSDLDALPHVTLSLSYPRSLAEGDLFRGFKKFTGIQKPLDWNHVCPVGAVDWNDGLCGVDHDLLEQLLKPSLTAKKSTLVNIWGGGNITEIALVRLILLLYS